MNVLYKRLPVFPVFFLFLPLGEAGEEGSVFPVGEPFLIVFFLPGLFGTLFEGSSLIFVYDL